MVDLIREFSIGINYIELFIEFQIFIFAIVRNKKSKGIQSRNLATSFGYFALFFFIARLGYILYDYYLFDDFYRYFAWTFGLIAAFFLMGFFFQIIRKISGEFRVFGRLLIVLGISIFILIAVILGVWVFRNLIFVEAFYIMLAIGTIFFMGFLYYAIKWLITLGVHIRRKMIMFLLGILILTIGFALSSIQPTLFKESPEIKPLGYIIFLIGLNLMRYSVTSLPSLAELDWETKIHDLYVLTTTGMSISEYRFQGRRNVDVDLFAGGITGILTIVKEMTESQKKLNSIPQEDANILLEYGEYIIIVLIAEQDLHILHEKMQVLVNRIETLFHQTLNEWDGKLEVFRPIPKIIQETFNIAQKGSVLS